MYSVRVDLTLNTLLCRWQRPSCCLRSSQPLVKKYVHVQETTHVSDMAEKRVALNTFLKDTLVPEYEHVQYDQTLQTCNGFQNGSVTFLYSLEL